MDTNFYKSAHGGHILGILAASPEELQQYAGPLLEVPEGSVLAARKRKGANGRIEILIGSAPVGEKLALEGENASPLPPVAAPAALDIPQNVKLATDANLELMAAANGVNVSEAWRKKPRNLRNAEVAKKMAERKAQPAGV